MESILKNTNQGLYCIPGDFYVDPRSAVPKAVVTHAHSDHAPWGCRSYLAAKPGEQLLRMRMNTDAEFQFLPYGESITLNGVQISFHPAGHILGSAQVRLEYQGQVIVITGDYKLEPDSTCEAWQPVPCHWMITESTFGLPIYRWQPQEVIMRSINRWWQETRDAGSCCMLYGYAVGKSQRLVAGLDPSIGPIYCHGAVENGNNAYRRSGVALPKTTNPSSITGKHDWAGSMIVAVPSAHGTPWARKFGRCSTAMASGWMSIRGARRRRSVDRGFSLSDHADWDSLLKAIEACNPEKVLVTHGYSATVVRFLLETGRDAEILDSRGRSEDDEDLVDAKDAISFEQQIDEAAS